MTKDTHGADVAVTLLRPGRADLLAFALVMLACLAVLFDRTWRHGEIFSPADAIFTAYPWAYSTDRPIAANLTRTDEAYYHQPLMATHWARLRRGDFPEWDPTALAGTPAFLQGLNAGQAFNPLSLPFYLFSPEVAVTLYAPVRLFVAGLGMWLYLRQRRFSTAAAAAGALSFSLNGAFIVWLSAPMPTVALWLPWILLAIDRTVEHCTPRDAARLAVVIGCMLLGAYLPTSFVVLATCAAYAAIQLPIAYRLSPLGISRAVRTASLMLAGALGGLVLAAVGLLPMLATLRDSPAAGRSVFNSTLPWQNLATFALPDVWGTPLAQNWWYAGPGNYPEFITYLGIGTIALAGAGIVAALKARDWATLALAGVGLVGLCAMYGVAPATWLGALPGFRQMNPYRWNVALACATSVLAACGLDALRGRGHWAPRAAQAEARALPPQSTLNSPELSPGSLATPAPAVRSCALTLQPFGPLAGAFVAVAILALVSGLAVWLRLDDIRRLSLQPFERAQILRFALIAAVTLGLAAAIAWSAARRAAAPRPLEPAGARLLAFALAALAAIDLLHFGHGFNPTLPRERYYPATSGLEQARALAGGGRIAPVAPPAQFVHGHVWSMFGLEVVSGFDFFGDAAYQRFLDRAAARHPLPTRWDFVGLERADARLLGLLNVTLIVTPPECAATNGAGYSTLGELTDGRRVTQEFAAEVEGLRGIDVFTAAYGRVNLGTLALTLRAPGAGEVVTARVIDAADVPENAWLRLEFPPQPRRPGLYRLEIEAHGAPPGRGATLWATAAPVQNGAALTVDGARDPRAIWYRAFAADPARVPGATLRWSGDLNIYRNDAALPRAWFVSKADVLPADQHLDELARPSFDLRSHALVAEPLPQATAASTARVTSIDASVPDWRRITVEAPDGGVLVVSERFAEGWTAEVDGHPATLVRANSVLLAIGVPAGTSTVVLSFASRTFWPSLAISSLALAGITLALSRHARTARPDGKLDETAPSLAKTAANRGVRSGPSDDETDRPDYDREISTDVVGRSNRPDRRLDR